ncbi:hypothetical protein VHUM_02872 [Vanrija humicola]|uniref:FAM192A/Fyv6 N-terminal domain-containing protein n=1 Tax=Vanrija humicola TaxID=5417 RepID=A0A7D8Z2G0_VANHU|nr:hypothetical protein VHUM_02872 [Vanrija humicola]
MEQQLETSGSALATGSIAARFVSQNALDEATARREQEWKDAYARIGQEPPPQMLEQPDDGRTLYEVGSVMGILKQEEWDDKMKLSNQYRGLQTEELDFLAEKIKEKRAHERKVEEEDNAEVMGYKEALAKRQATVLAAAEPQLATAAKPPAPPAKRIPPKPVKKDIKSLMKGVVVKKKPKPTTGAAPKLAAESSKRPREEDDEPSDKKRKP